MPLGISLIKQNNTIFNQFCLIYLPFIKKYIPIQVSVIQNSTHSKGNRNSSLYLLSTYTRDDLVASLYSCKLLYGLVDSSLLKLFLNNFSSTAQVDKVWELFTKKVTDLLTHAVKVHPPLKNLGTNFKISTEFAKHIQSIDGFTWTFVSWNKIQLVPLPDWPPFFLEIDLKYPHSAPKIHWSEYPLSIQPNLPLDNPLWITCLNNSFNCTKLSHYDMDLLDQKVPNPLVYLLNSLKSKILKLKHLQDFIKNIACDNTASAAGFLPKVQDSKTSSNGKFPICFRFQARDDKDSISTYQCVVNPLNVYEIPSTIDNCTTGTKLSVPNNEIEYEISKSPSLMTATPDTPTAAFFEKICKVFHLGTLFIGGIDQKNISIDSSIHEDEPTCSICMCGSLSEKEPKPDISCSKCKNEYHYSCLLDWFESDSKSTGNQDVMFGQCLFCKSIISILKKI